MVRTIVGNATFRIVLSRLTMRRLTHSTARTGPPRRAARCPERAALRVDATFASDSDPNRGLTLGMEELLGSHRLTLEEW